MKDERPQLDLEAEALAALKGILRNAADLRGICFAKRGRPPKT